MPRIGAWLMGAAKCAAAVFLLLVLLQNMFNTVYMDYWEHNFFLPDQPLRHILFLAAVVFAAVLIWKRRASLEKLLARRAWILPAAAVLYAAFLIFWVVTTRCVSQEGTDSTVLLEIVRQFRGGDFHAYDKGGYLYTYPHQTGMVIILYAFDFLFGPENYLALELINAGGALLLVCTMARMAERLTAKKSAALAVLLAACAFYPIALYVSFVYGVLWGLALSVQAFYWQLRWMQTGRWRYAAAAGLFIGCACVVKENSMIMLLAMLVVFALRAPREKSMRPLAAALAVLMLFFGVTLGESAVMSFISGGRNRGVTGNPPLTHVAMGLQEGPMAPGWFNGYVLSCMPDSGFDSTAASRRVKADIAARLEKFAAVPELAADFFGRKIASEWCSADFGGMWVVWVRPSGLENPSWLYLRITNPTSRTHTALVHYMNFFETLVYAGALLAMLLSSRRITEENGAYLIAFLGGFLCHIFWEGSCQYTFPYFVLLIPYAVMGYALLARWIAQRSLTPEMSGRRMAVCKGAAAAALVLVLLLPPAFSAFTDAAQPNDAARYRSELAEEEESGYWIVTMQTE